MASTESGRSRRSTLPFVAGIGAGILLTLALVSAVYFWLNRPPPAPPTWAATVEDAAGDVLDGLGQPAEDYPAYADILNAEILVGDEGILNGGRSTGAAAGEEAPLIALVTLRTAASIPPPPELSRGFSLGVALDADGNPDNNDTSTPNLIDTDTTIAISCDPTAGRCLEGIATFDGASWTLSFSEITWDIQGDRVRLAFPLEFLAGAVEPAGWRAFSSIIDAEIGGVAFTDIAPGAGSPLIGLEPLE